MVEMTNDRKNYWINSVEEDLKVNLNKQMLHYVFLH